MRKSTVVPIILLLVAVVVTLLVINTLHYFSGAWRVSVSPGGTQSAAAKYAVVPIQLPATDCRCVTGRSLLGLAGWLCQLLLKNPLAEPATLGIASGRNWG